MNSSSVQLFSCVSLGTEISTGAVIFTYAALVSHFDSVDLVQTRVGDWLEPLAAFRMKRPLLRVIVFVAAPIMRCVAELCRKGKVTSSTPLLASLSLSATQVLRKSQCTKSRGMDQHRRVAPLAYWARRL